MPPQKFCLYDDPEFKSVKFLKTSENHDVDSNNGVHQILLDEFVFNSSKKIPLSLQEANFFSILQKKKTCQIK